jgi:uncharacterized protein (TIGR02145 family)
MAKNKAWIQYTRQGQIVPGSLIVSSRRPVNGVWYEVITDICCDTEFPFGLISSKQKAFIKYDASGNIVPGSLVLTDGRLPRPGIWKEVYIDICCSISTTTTTSTEAPPPFPIVTIGSQIWSQVNLEVTTYRNGDPIPEVTDPTQWQNLTTGAWCYYDNDPANGLIYGKLYNWAAVNDPRGLAPTGWHIPTILEWVTLETTLGGALVAGGAMKEVGTTHWLAPNTGATNSSGWTGLPGGIRNFGAPFTGLGFYGDWWSSTELNATNAYYRGLWFNSSSVENSGTSNKQQGFSVRIIKD